MKLGRVFLWGLIISFLGSLPLGPLNLFTTYIAASKGFGTALAFAAGCILSELIFVRVTLISMNWLSQQQKLFRLLEWITITIILALAIFSFLAAIYKKGFTAAMPVNIRYPFWYGVLISAIDPMKIPFWFLWRTFLMANKILINRNLDFNAYVLGIGFGSLMGFLVFVFGGNYLIGSIESHQDLINWAIGIILLITAIVQLIRIYGGKKAILQ